MVAFVVWMAGLVKVILTGDRCGGSELAMLCMMLLILGLPLTGTVMFLDTCGDTLVTSFSITGEELDELVRRRFLGFSSSSEQLTPVRTVANHSFDLQTPSSHHCIKTEIAGGDMQDWKIPLNSQVLKKIFCSIISLLVSFFVIGLTDNFNFRNLNL